MTTRFGFALQYSSALRSATTTVHDVSFSDIHWIPLTVFGIGIIGQFGFVVVRKLIPQLELSIAIGTGILIGLSTFGVVQTSVPILRRYPWLALVLFGVIAMLTSISGRKWNSPVPSLREMRQSMTANGLDSRSVMVVLGAAVFGLSYFSVWTHALGLALVGLGLSMKRSGGRAARSVAIARLAFGTLVVVAEWIRRLEPSWWFSAEPDTPFFESLGWSLATWGPSAHPGLPERSIYGYHYLAYAVSGSVSHLSGAPPYVILNIVVPFAMLISLSLVLLPELRRRTSSLLGAAVVLLVYFALLNVSSTTSFKYSVWAIVVYFILAVRDSEHTCSRRGRLRHELLFAVVGLIAVFGKATALPAIVSIGLWTGWGRLRRARPRTKFDFCIAAPTHLVMLGIFFLTYYPTISPLKTGSSLIDGLTDERLLDDLWAVRLPLLVMFTLAATAMLAWLSLAEVQTTTAKDLSLLAWTAVFGIATLLVSPSPPVLTYLIAHQYQLLFLTLLAPASLYLKARRDTRGILAAGALAISFIAISSLDTSNLYENLAQALSGKRAVRWTLWMLSEIPMFSALFFTAGCVVWVTTRRAKATQELRLNFLSAASAVLLLTHVSMISSDNVREYSTLLRDPTRTFSFFAAHPDNATSDVGRFIRESTPNDVVISSNSFCCLGTDWLADEVKSLSAFESLTTHPSYGWTSWGGFNYALASVSRRQFLLAGPAYLVTRDTAGLVSRRLEASVLYGATGSNSHLGILRADGADYFVVDKAALGDLAVPTFEERTIFENSRYLVLDLAS